MSSDPTILRNGIFGKVAHLVLSERELVKHDYLPKADHNVRRTFNSLPISLRGIMVLVSSSFLVYKVLCVFLTKIRNINSFLRYL